jgi:hypothetical protein
LDTKAPVVTVSGLATTRATPAIGGTLSDGTLRVAVNGRTYTPGDGRLTVGDATWLLQIPDAAALTVGTYDVSAVAMDLAGNIGRDATTNELHIQSDRDTDGIADVIEAGSPNGGDGNRDGIPDSQQGNVASVRTTKDDMYLTLAASSGQTLADVRAVPNPSPTDTPQTAQFPVSFLEFSVASVPSTGATTVTLFVEAGARVNAYYKYGPTRDNMFGHWYPFMFDGLTGAVVFSDRIELHFVDGQRGDDDLQFNQRILDVGAPGFTRNPWQNPLLQYDVNNDGRVVGVDALVLINEINLTSEITQTNSRNLPDLPEMNDYLPPYLDVDGNGRLEPVDVLNVIDYINSHPVMAGEGESVALQSRAHASGGLPGVHASPKVINWAEFLHPEIGPYSATVGPPAYESAGPSGTIAHEVQHKIRCQDSANSRGSLNAAPEGQDVQVLRRDVERRVRTLEDLDVALAGLDAILQEIAADVAYAAAARRQPSVT